jgi:hypothetical protein
MTRTKKPTIKQKQAFEEMLKAVKTGKDVNLKAIMIKSGYTEATAEQPAKNLTSKPQWQQLLNTIDNEAILNTFYQIMLARDEDGNVKDKDAAIKAAKELATLKDLYPASKSKIIGLFDKIDSISE